MTFNADAISSSGTIRGPGKTAGRRARPSGPSRLVLTLVLGCTLSAALGAAVARHLPQGGEASPIRQATAEASSVAPVPVPPLPVPRPLSAAAKSSRLSVPAHQAERRPTASPTRTARNDRVVARPVAVAAANAIDVPHRLFVAAHGEATTFLPSAAFRVALTESRKIALALPAPVPEPQVASVPVPTLVPALPSAAAAEAPVQVASLEPASLPASIADAPETQIDATVIPTPRARPRHRMQVPAEPAVVSARPARRETPTPVLAYARPDAGDEDTSPLSSGRSFARPGNGVAVYDISAATVYLPNGEKLEAHSGLGMMRDDPSYAHKKNRGPTPPHTYTLSMRESLFHGVRAIRLNPVGGQGAIHNRNGLLAHTYMLGRRGDSNGCVSFKDYKRFLAAFQRGDVKKLVVVARLSNNPIDRFASLFR